MKRRDLSITVPWMNAGTTLFFDRAVALDKHQLRAPSALPDWTNAHVVAHVARNAEAMSRLIFWASTGMETPAYSSPEQRAADIEQSAQQSPDELRNDLRSAATRLRDAVTACPAARWHAHIRGASGRQMQAIMVPWLRTREVHLHALDLTATPMTIADLPADIQNELLDDLASSFVHRPDTPTVLATATDSGRMWAFGESGQPTMVSGTTSALVGWLTGRTGGADLECNGPIPILPPWL